MHRALPCVVITLFGLLSIACAIPLQAYTGSQLFSRANSGGFGPVTLNVRFPRGPYELPASFDGLNRTALSEHEQKDHVDASAKLIQVNDKVRKVVEGYFKTVLPQAYVQFDERHPFANPKWKDGEDIHAKVDLRVASVGKLYGPLIRQWLATVKSVGSSYIGSLIADNHDGTGYPKLGSSR
ncbi:hypothetical protein F5050DRAFT_1751626 [Lentinula boryana]|uniref:Uncharacterized protein n=1 Tax=Lentinula boryana TaxID=40481 RepID=A0ABQ8QG74_9AGAR|nr:hypothetical protein F5050DRAFT_1751626 [Lentinula boryana]